MTADRLRLAFLAEPAEVLAQLWMSAFAAFGHEVILITRPDASVPADLDPRIRVEPLARVRGAVGRRLTAPSVRRATRTLLRRVRPDVVHVHDLTSGFGWTAWLSGFHPYVVTAWGSDLYIALPRARPSRIVGRLALRGADLVTVETADLAKAAVAAGAHRDHVRIVQFGVDTTEFAPAAPDPDLVESLGLANRRVVFSPRQIAPLYDHRSVLRAVARLPSDVVVLMSRWRAVPSEEDALRTLAAELGLSDRLRFVDGIRHGSMPEYLRLATVVVSVPRSDSISVSVLEAMATGRPVVVSDLPSPREWLSAVYGDLIVPVGDVDALARSLDRVLDWTPLEAERRATIARAIVAERAERETSMRTMEQHYRRLAANRRRDGER